MKTSRRGMLGLSSASVGAAVAAIYAPEIFKEPANAASSSASAPAVIPKLKSIMSDATITLKDNSRIATITITNPGMGYTTPPKFNANGVEHA
jgi:hypothetical protein